MFELICDFFYGHVFVDNGNWFLYDFTFDVFGQTIDMATYLTFICSLVSIVFIVVLCCLFVYKIIRLVGGLISR